MGFRIIIFMASAISLSVAQIHEVTLSESLRALSSGRRDIVLDMDPVLGDVLTHPTVAGLSGDTQRNRIISLLKERTRISQIPLINALATLGLAEKSKAYWVANRIVVRDVDVPTIQALSKVPGVPFTIREPIKVKIFPVVETKENVKVEGKADALQYGVEKIGAPQAWAQGYTGKGIVIGVIDTGVNAKHEALRDNYKNDNSSWHDAFGMYTDAPYDGNGHGTHCAGTIAGKANGIGVAPDAKFIACRGLDDEGSGDDTTLMDCGQFMACPSGNGSSECSGFPHAVSNSWGGLIGGQDFYNPIIKTWRALNIIPVFALGNSGPLCMTSGSPGDQDGLISVGATDNKDKLASFSSRGPALGSGKLKPEVSAPGKDIISAKHDDNTGYRKLSGTSMACPHVAGAVAVILSANPNATFYDVLDALEKTAAKPQLIWSDAPKVCSFPGKYPNNGYGYGRISCPDAVTQIKGIPSNATVVA